LKVFSACPAYGALRLVKPTGCQRTGIIVISLILPRTRQAWATVAATPAVTFFRKAESSVESGKERIPVLANPEDRSSVRRFIRSFRTENKAPSSGRTPEPPPSKLRQRLVAGLPIRSFEINQAPSCGRKKRSSHGLWLQATAGLAPAGP